MDEIRKSEIIYEEGWRERVSNNSLPELSDDIPLDEASKPIEDSSFSGHDKSSGLLLLTVQLIVCIILAIVILLLKTADSPVYRGFMDWFRNELNKPVISQGVFSTIDESLFKNHASASPDEAQTR